MSLIDRVGLFKVEIIDSGVVATKELAPGERDDGSLGGLPQFVVTVRAEEMYDGENWIDWSEYDQELTGYLILKNHDKKDSFKTEFVMDATGWDGKSYAELDALDLAGRKIKVEITENEFENKTSLQISWIGSLDANPNRGVKKLDAKALKSLDAKFGRKVKAKPAKAESKSKAKVPPKSAPKKSAPKGKSKTEGYTKDEAWDHLCDSELWKDKVDGREMSEAVLTDLWSKAIEEMGDDEDKFSDESWFIIYEKLATIIFKF